MGRTCKLCHHPKRKAIEAAILSGEKGVSIAERFGVTNVNISRHRTGHMMPMLKQAIAAQPESSEKLVDRLERMYIKAEEVLVAAQAGGKHSLSLAAIKELRGLVELLGKFTGELNDRPQVQVNLVASPEWHQVRDVVFQVLQHYPGATEELSGRLLELESR